MRFITLLVILLLLPILLLPIALALPHEQHASFSSIENRISMSDSSYFMIDDAIYRTGYYSINGTAWTPFTLEGNAYPESDDWLSSSASYTLPSSSLSQGEHYVIVYSCSHDGNEWDCHGRNQEERGFWQLQIVDNDGSCIDSCSRLGHQCGTHTICGNSVTCGGCDVYGHDVGMACVDGVCKDVALGNTYYVATDGDNSNPGTIFKPWATLQQAVYLARPGDIVYVRGGTYYPTQPITWNSDTAIGVKGTKDAPIRYFNYPGERPIFDFKNTNLSRSYFNGGFSLYQMEYVHLRGMTVRNVLQAEFDEPNNRYYSAGGISCISCANMLYENLVVHDIGGRGFEHWGGAWSEKDAQHSIDSGYRTEYMEPVFESDTTKWLNCDAYNLVDLHSFYYLENGTLHDNSGNRADGWKVGGYYGNDFYWEGCRAWNYSDDGFDPHGAPYRTFKHVWASAGDYFEGLTGVNEGNGIKMTGVNPDMIDGYEIGKENMVFVENSIAAFNQGVGFYNNIVVRYDVNNQWPNNGVFYNNLAYKNGMGYADKNGSIHRNNIVYDSQSFDSRNVPYEMIVYRSVLDESHNTWFGRPRSGDWWWRYNTDYNVTDDDFVSLDYNQLKAPRKSDFSLPDITFGKLRSDSDLIDGGVDVGLPFAGSAPDLGPFEYGLEPEVICLGPSVRPCIAGDGIGEQKRSCLGPGEWSSWSSCEFISCDDGYVLEDGACVIGPGWSRELLFNGGFEGSVDGWVTSDNEWVAETHSHAYPSKAQSGHFWAKSMVASADGYIYQDVDLSEYADYIDADLVVANISGWGRTHPRYQSSARTRIQFMALDMNKEIISTLLDTDYVLDNEWWEASVVEGPIPIGTRYIRVWGNTYGTSHSGDLDSFSVKVNVLEG